MEGVLKSAQGIFMRIKHQKSAIIVQIFVLAVVMGLISVMLVLTNIIIIKENVNFVIKPAKYVKVILNVCSVNQISTCLMVSATITAQYHIFHKSITLLDLEFVRHAIQPRELLMIFLVKGALIFVEMG